MEELEYNSFIIVYGSLKSGPQPRYQRPRLSGLLDPVSKNGPQSVSVSLRSIPIFDKLLIKRLFNN